MQILIKSFVRPIRFLTYEWTSSDVSIQNWIARLNASDFLLSAICQYQGLVALARSGLDRSLLTLVVIRASWVVRRWLISDDWPRSIARKTHQRRRRRSAARPVSSWRLLWSKGHHLRYLKCDETDTGVRWDVHGPSFTFCVYIT